MVLGETKGLDHGQLLLEPREQAWHKPKIPGLP